MGASFHKPFFAINNKPFWITIWVKLVNVPEIYITQILNTISQNLELEMQSVKTQWAHQHHKVVILPNCSNHGLNNTKNRQN